MITIRAVVKALYVVYVYDGTLLRLDQAIVAALSLRCCYVIDHWVVFVLLERLPVAWKQHFTGNNSRRK